MFDGDQPQYQYRLAVSGCVKAFDAQDTAAPTVTSLMMRMVVLGSNKAGRIGFGSQEGSAERACISEACSSWRDSAVLDWLAVLCASRYSDRFTRPRLVRRCVGVWAPVEAELTG